MENLYGIIENNENDENISFNRLLKLQELIKKEAILKEHFISTGNDLKKKIKEQSLYIHKNKIELLNILQKYNNNKSKNNPDKNVNKSSISQNEILKENILVEYTNEYLSELNPFASDLLSLLWKNPKLMAELLINVDIEDTKNYLAPLICNNYYDNILSSNSIEDPLIYIIYILLDKEIENIDDIKNTNNFLYKTHCRYLLGQLIERKDVKNFFKIIFENILEDISSKKLNFDLKKIKKNQEKKKESLNIKKSKTMQSDTINNIINDNKVSQKLPVDNDYKSFLSKYVVDIHFDDLNKKKDNYDNEIMKDYFEYILLNANKDEHAYFQDSFKKSIADINNSANILSLYYKDFMKTTKFIEEILVKLNENYFIVPYSIKCVCSIIYKLVMNKFPKANNIEKNLLISRFFFQIILIPFLSKTDLNSLVNKFIITNSLLYNLHIISKVLLQLVTFQLYKNESNIEGNNYSPFNAFFLKEITYVFDFYEKISKIQLPLFINKLINKKISIDEYYFDYFEENPNKILFHRSILINIDEFNIIFQNLLKNKHKLLSKNNKSKEQAENIRCILVIIDKLNKNENKKILNKLLEHNDFTVMKKEIKIGGFFKSKTSVIEEKKQNIKYFYVDELLFNDKYKKFFSLEQDKPYYNKKQIKNITNKELMDKNNIIKAKNNISSILYNYKELEKNDFSVGALNKTVNIINELNAIIKSSNIITDGKIPLEWHLQSLLKLLYELPLEYQVNDYEKLFNELEDELMKSIKQYNLEEISLFMDKIKFAIKNTDIIKEIITNKKLNSIVKNIIENEIIQLTINFRVNKNKQEIYFNKEILKKEQIEHIGQYDFYFNKKGFCNTIEEFIYKFPNFNEDLSLDGEIIDEKEIIVFEKQKQMKLPENLNFFFNYIEELVKKKVTEEIDINTINDKIYDYVMSNIYSKIYPKEQHIYDEQILEKLEKLSWIRPEDLVGSNIKLDFDLILPDIIKYFKLMREEKSPYKKFQNLENIFTTLRNLFIFSGLEEESNALSLDVLPYYFINIRPTLVYTDCKYIELYLDKKRKNISNYLIDQMINVYNLIKDLEVKKPLISS